MIIERLTKLVNSEFKTNETNSNNQCCENSVDLQKHFDVNVNTNLVNSWKFKCVELVCSGSPQWRLWTGGHFNSHLRPSIWS